MPHHNLLDNLDAPDTTEAAAASEQTRAHAADGNPSSLPIHGHFYSLHRTEHAITLAGREFKTLEQVSVLFPTGEVSGEAHFYRNTASGVCYLLFAFFLPGVAEESFLKLPNGTLMRRLHSERV